jgi:drug/metabolite transporter (DMT)-like permease
MPTAGHTMSLLEWSLLVLLSVLWGATYFFVEIALRELPPLWLVCLRVGLAALALQLFMLLRGIRIDLTARLAGQLLVMGLLNNVIPFSLIFWSQIALDSSLAAILTATTPFWVVLLAHGLTTDEKATPGKLAGIAIGWAGVAVMVGPAALDGLGEAVLPQLAVLLGALSYAASGIFGRRFQRLPPVAIAGWQLTGSAVMMAVVVALTQPVPSLAALAPATWAAVLALALVSTALAYVLFFRILSTAGATNLLLVTLLIPVTAVALGGFFLGERLGPEEVLGMALILVGLAVIDGRIVARLRPQPKLEPKEGSPSCSKLP